MKLKRSFDLLCAISLLIVVAPLLLLISIMLFIREGRPIIFSQDRVGLDCEIFRIVKFRTMVKNAEAEGEFRTEKNDRRITALGAFLRQTSVDELPQLWNVLNGTMSLVGPRPFSPKQQSEHSEAHWKKRHSVRPGMTGLAQIRGRSALMRGQKMKLDLEYVDKQSFAFDLTILFKTPAVVFFRRNLSN